MTDPPVAMPFIYSARDMRTWSFLSAMSTSRPALSSAVAAIASLVAMLGCCLPLPALLAAGSFGAAAGRLPAARPYLLAASAASLAFAFYWLYHRRYRESPRPWWAQALVWISFAAVLTTGLFPQWTANLLAGLPSTPASQPRARGKQIPLVAFRQLDPLRDSFNAAVTQTRILALLSPT